MKARTDRTHARATLICPALVAIFALTSACGGGAGPQATASPDGTGTSEVSAPSKDSAETSQGSGKLWNAPKSCPDLTEFGDINEHVTYENFAESTGGLSCGDYPLEGGTHSVVVSTSPLKPTEILAQLRRAEKDADLTDLQKSDRDVAMPELGAGAVRREIVTGNGWPTCDLFVPMTNGTLVVGSGSFTSGNPIKDECAMALKVLRRVG